jgi:hypothetical protein
LVNFTAKEDITPMAGDCLSSIDNGNHVEDGLAEGSFGDEDDEEPQGKTCPPLQNHTHI